MEIENKGNPEADELIKKALILIEDAEIEIERGGNPTLSEALGLIFEAQWVEGISLAQKKESADIDGYIHWLRREYPLADLRWHEVVEEDVDPSISASAFAGLGRLALSYGDKVAAEEIMVTCYSLLSGSDPAKIKPYQLERINSFAADLAMIGQKDLAKELLDELLRVVSFVEKSIQEPEKAGKLRDLKENIEWKIKNLFT